MAFLWVYRVTRERNKTVDINRVRIVGLFINSFSQYFNPITVYIMRNIVLFIPKTRFYLFV